jgi:quercetin dioxygenase-like cupin family protein
MADYTTKRIDEMEAIFLGSFKRACAELGASSFGMQVIDFPPNADRYPEHDHAASGQEEVYVPIRGRGELSVDGETVPLEEGMMVRVGPAARRKITTQDESMRLLALGGVPGKPYEPSENSKLGNPDPMAQAAR